MSTIFDRLASPEDEPPTPEESPPPEETAPPESGTPSQVKEITQELIRHGSLEESRKPALFRAATVHEHQIAAALEPLDLALRLDTHRGVAFLTVAEPTQENTAEESAWSHPLVRRQRLTLEQSLIVALLRQEFVVHEQEAGVGHSAAKSSTDDLLPQFLTYFEDSGSDTKNESRLSNILDQLKTYGIVSEVDKNDAFTIRPMIAHLANPESLTALLREFQERST